MDDIFRRRRIGKTGLHLPLLGLGTAHFGGMYQRVSGDEAQATLRAAWDGGVRYFDSAPFYGRGLSEHRLGSFLIDRPREEFFITTKIGRVFSRPANPDTLDRTPWDGGLKFEFRFDYSYDGVMRSYEQSLMRLGIDTVDALLVHDPDAVLHEDEHAGRMRELGEGGYKALENLKSSGEIKAIGMGLNRPESLTSIAPLFAPDFLIVAMPYTLLDQSGLHAGLNHCVRNEVSVVIGAPFASGILATGPRPEARYGYEIASEEILEKARQIQAVCREHDVSLQSAALQFPLGHPAVVAIIPGAAKPAEVIQNISSMRAPVPETLWQTLKTEGLIDKESPLPSKTVQ